MDKILQTFDSLIIGNSVERWLQALVMTSVAYLLLALIRRAVQHNYARMAQTVEVEFMELPLHIVSRTTATFMLSVSVYLGLNTLNIGDSIRTLATKAVIIVACWQVGIWASAGAIAWLDIKQHHTFKHDRAAVGMLGIVRVIVRAAIWSVVLLLTLDNLNVKISTLVAGLGITGVAVALAVQNVLGDLLASLAITLDKPFVVGDALGVDNFNGTVEYIGLKTTRLRSPTGEQIVMPNANLLASRLRNYSRQAERQIVTKLSVARDTPRATLAQVPHWVRTAFAPLSDVRFDRCHLVGFNAASADFELMYTVLKPDYEVFLDIQQTINLQLHELFERQQLKFA